MSTASQDFGRIASVPPTVLGEQKEGFDRVKGFLSRFGYLDPKQMAPTAAEATKLDDSASSALARYQAFHGLRVTGIFDEDTRQMMTMSRCALPDQAQGSPLAFSTTCKWNKDTITFAFENGTADIAGDGEKDAVRNAFATWSATVQLAFREVGTNESPDIQVGWRQANDADLDMTGSILAHADYPPGCGYINNTLPRPLHYDDQEHNWTVGASAGSYDVETIALHEIGHLLGMQHSSVQGAIMFPTVSPNYTARALAADDIEGIRKLYPQNGPIFLKHSGLAVDVYQAATANGTEFIQWDYWGGANQLFKIEWVEAGHYRFIAQHTGKVLDVEAASTADLARLIQWDWWGGNNQKFRLEAVGHGWYRVVAKHSGKVVDAYQASTANGAGLIQYGWWGGDNQRLRIGPAPIYSRGSGKCLDVEAISTANGARLIQWDYWGGANQRFRLDPVGGGFYRVMIERSGKCLDVEGISTANGARIIQWPYWGGDNQKFKPEPVGGGYYKLTAKHSGKCVDVYQASTANGAGIIQWDYWGGDNQKWRL